MRVLVCGGREHTGVTARRHVFVALDLLHRGGIITEICHGAAPGIDSHAELWAKSREVDYRGYPAKWQIHGRSAGMRRNKRMLAKFDPDTVLAFPGKGPGTPGMIKLARAANIDTIIGETIGK